MSETVRNVPRLLADMGNWRRGVAFLVLGALNLTDSGRVPLLEKRGALAEFLKMFLGQHFILKSIWPFFVPNKLSRYIYKQIEWLELLVGSKNTPKLNMNLWCIWIPSTMRRFILCLLNGVRVFATLLFRSSQCFHFFLNASPRNVSRNLIGIGVCDPYNIVSSKHFFLWFAVPSFWPNKKLVSILGTTSWSQTSRRNAAANESTTKNCSNTPQWWDKIFGTLILSTLSVS